LLIDLLLPDLDGFEVCQTLRFDLAEQETAIVCMSAVPWPFGADDVAAISDLVEEYEREVAHVAPDVADGTVQLRHEYQTEVGSRDEGFTALTQDISPGGFFVRTYCPPQLHDIVQVCLELPDGERTVRAQARVAHQVSPEKAKLHGLTPGFGVELVDATDEDLALLEDLVRGPDQGGARASDAPSGAGSSGQLADGERNWVVLLGLSAKALRRRPSFLQRSNIGLVAFPDLESAEDFLRANPIAACVIADAALGDDAEPVFLRVARLAGGDGKRVVLSRRPEVDKLLASGRCDAAFDPEAGIDAAVEDLRRCLGIPDRAEQRVVHEARVHIQAPCHTYEGKLLQLNSGSLLMRSAKPLSVGGKVQIALSLPDVTPPIRAEGLVLRCTRPQDADSHVVGVAFSTFADADEGRLKAYVRGRVSFRELFTWLKQHHFGVAAPD
jgi:Tfp pilus assembly protein PilZ